jgi:hypothetical protein
VGASCQAALLRVNLTRNLAALCGRNHEGLDTGATMAGGAIAVYGPHSWLELTESNILDNVVDATGGMDAQGGAIHAASGANVSIVRCMGEGNAAIFGSGMAVGGFLAINPPCIVSLFDSSLIANEARSGTTSGSQSGGGAVYIHDTPSPVAIHIAASRLLRNRVYLSNPRANWPASGGAILAKAAQQCDLRISDSTIANNEAVGPGAAGGAIWVSCLAVSLTRTTLKKNVASAGGSRLSGLGSADALGGAVFLAIPASARFLDSTFLENEALLLELFFSDALAGVWPLQASAGAVYVSSGARASIQNCTLLDNAAGGVGANELADFATPARYAQARRNKATSARQIHILGQVLLNGSIFIDGRGVKLGDATAWWWIVCDSAAVVEMQTNVFSARGLHFFDECPYTGNYICEVGGTDPLCPDGGDYVDCLSAVRASGSPGKFLHAFSPLVQVVIRNCTFSNGVLGAETATNSGLSLTSRLKLGVVNSVFGPPVDSTVPLVQPPRCDELVAGRPLCDPRASCIPAQSGGVTCSCSGKGLRDQDGLLTDARRCMQDVQMRLFVQSESFMLRLQKPSSPGNSTRIQILLQAEGEHAITVGYSMRATHTIGGAVMTIVSSSSNEWERLTNSTFSFHGLHMAWDRPPSADAELDLDGEAMRFSAAKAFAVEFAADCNGARPCAQDGDTFETLLSVEAQSDATNLRSVVTVTTVMESLLSCDHSLVSVELDVVPIATPIRVQLFVNDVDSFPVRYTRVEVTLIFGGRNIPVQWNRGSNEYVADVPAALTAQPGLYNLVLSASNAWNGTAGRVTSCELLRRTITVKEGLSTNWILVGAGTAAVVVVGALALVVRKRHAHLQAILTMLLTEMGMLVFSICTALANLVTDGIVFGRLLRDELKVSSRVTRQHTRRSSASGLSQPPSRLATGFATPA